MCVCVCVWCVEGFVLKPRLFPSLQESYEARRAEEAEARAAEERRRAEEERRRGEEEARARDAARAEAERQSRLRKHDDKPPPAWEEWPVIP